MKRCPACDKTFADGMKFCQTDGTLLVDDAPPADPYKTVVGNQNDLAASPLDPFKTMVAGLPKNDEDLLQLPDERDSMKTMVVSQDELLDELKSFDAPVAVTKSDVSPPQYAPSAPLIEPKPASSPKDEALPAPPKFDEPLLPAPKSAEPSLSDATAVMDQSAMRENAPPSPFDSKPAAGDFSTRSPYGNQENKPIPSPFDGSMIGYQPPTAPPPFDQPKSAAPPPFKEAESPFGDYKESGGTTPFGNAEPFNQPVPAAEWTPPPAPVSEWQNQDLGANTPFQPPGAASGQDQTLAIVSLVCGILGLVCCGLFTGIPAIITGYMAKNNVDSNPNQYGGRGLAVAGMIMGGISILFSILGFIYYIILIASVGLQ